MIKNKDEAKSKTEHISCDCKCKFNSTICNSSQNEIIKHVNMNSKVIVNSKNIMIGILAHVFVRIVSN